MSWIKTKNRLPDTDRLCWLYNEDTHSIQLGVLLGYDEGIVWAFTNGQFTKDFDKIRTDYDEELQDEFTHWQYVPDLP